MIKYFKLILNLMLVLNLADVCYAALNDPQKMIDTNLLDVKIATFVISDGSISEIISLLQKEYFVPISFIDAEESPKLTIKATNISVRELLNIMVAQAPLYSYESIENRVVVYPELPLYSLIMKDVNIIEMERYSAAVNYLKKLKGRYTEFEKYYPPVIFGNKNSSISTEKVSLKSEARVIEHFVELLGPDPNILFMLRKAASGNYFIHFEEISNK